MSTDIELAQIIESELLNDHSLSAATIQIGIQDGAVTLVGIVHSFRHKLLADNLVRGIDGVRSVNNQLTVEPDVNIPDEHVEQEVRVSLEANADINKAAISVDCRGGKVTLRGNVGDNWERSIAEDVTRGVRGVREVTNLLAVNRSQKIEDQELCSSIRAALTRTSELHGSDLSVAITDGTVILAGAVDAFWQAELAESIVRGFDVLHVRNDIAVRA
jgi:osmotically-inducible protein OsmY